MPTTDTITRETTLCISLAARPSNIRTRFHNFLVLTIAPREQHRGTLCIAEEWPRCCTLLLYLLVEVPPRGRV